MMVFILNNKEIILEKVNKLYKEWKMGHLGGELMPEDSNPGLEKGSLENYLYFTLPMALNYQRNSYQLWESVYKTYQDENTMFVFSPNEVLKHSFEDIQFALTKYKVALQKNKQTEIWIKLCETISSKFDGDIRKLYSNLNYNVNEIKNYMQKEYKKEFPYLGGNKICNYWLYVMYQYTNVRYVDVRNITVAPDTHVIKATYKLGMISEDEFNSSMVQDIVAQKWNELLNNEKLSPIDMHTPLWLWSRGSFKINLDI